MKKLSGMAKPGSVPEFNVNAVLRQYVRRVGSCKITVLRKRGYGQKAKKDEINFPHH
jgi:hypothetical protein